MPVHVHVEHSFCHFSKAKLLHCFSFFVLSIDNSFRKYLFQTSLKPCGLEYTIDFHIKCNFTFGHHEHDPLVSLGFGAEIDMSPHKPARKKYTP